MARPNVVERKIALCYIRLSVTKDASDLTSPERQRANIDAACRKYGWIPEWYEDAKGHKSATKEENRPAWQALKTRLGDPDVAALVVNEQSRAMRNAWRAIKVFEELPGQGVVLHLAALDRTIDITTPDGRMSAYIQAFLDDMYASMLRAGPRTASNTARARGSASARRPLGRCGTSTGTSRPRHLARGSCPMGRLDRAKTSTNRPIRTPRGGVTTPAPSRS
ncbi:MAG: recombinase family protein [Chloroflexi bacterium]|nr:recombinase family protein [Chloroflexota bacterium]